MTTDKLLSEEEVTRLKEKFSSVKVEPDTHFIKVDYRYLQGMPVRYEEWFWDGISASSVVIPNSALGAKTEEELLALLKQHFSIEENHTYKKVDEFTYVNFNFSVGKHVGFSFF